MERTCKLYRLDYKIEVLSGLHIGSGDSKFDIGGSDATVIKDPLGRPYIPGSSLKGKIRDVLTKKHLGENDKNEIIIFNDNVRKLFEPLENDTIKVSRAIFRDGILDEEQSKEVLNVLGENNYTEIKAENSIDKLTGEANPRFIEIVPRGMVFNASIILQVFDEDMNNNNDNEDGKTPEYVMKEELVKGIKALENSYIGANGTRGYGNIKITFIKKVDNDESNESYNKLFDVIKD